MADLAGADTGTEEGFFAAHILSLQTANDSEAHADVEQCTRRCVRDGCVEKTAVVETDSQNNPADVPASSRSKAVLPECAF